MSTQIREFQTDALCFILRMVFHKQYSSEHLYTNQRVRQMFFVYFNSVYLILVIILHALSFLTICPPEIHIYITLHLYYHITLHLYHHTFSCITVSLFLPETDSPLLTDQQNYNGFAL